MTEFNSPVLTTDIPDQTVYAGLDIKQLNLNNFIANTSPEDGDIQFAATLSDGQPLPNGVVCEPNGVFSGKPSFQAIRGEGYAIMVVAKNNADIPLIAQFTLFVSEANDDILEAYGVNIEEGVFTAGEAIDAPTDALLETADEAGEDSFQDIDREFEDFLESLDVDEVSKNPAMLEEAFGEQMAFSDELNDPEYLAFVIRYFIRKFSSIQLYNADQLFNEFDIVGSFEASTGWTVYDSEFALTTTNPQPYAADFSRSDLIATLKEMIGTAAQRGWNTIGVRGCDPQLGYRLVSEFNQTATSDLRMNVDHYADLTTWHERAENDRFRKTFISR